MLKPKSKAELTEGWFEELEKFPLSENSWLELKERIGSEIGNKIVNLLNSDSGGLILVGVAQGKNGKATVKGVANVQEEMNKLSDFLSNITDSCNEEVKPELVTYKGKNVLAVFINSGAKFPYFYKGVIYVGAGANTYPVTNKRQIIALLSSQIDRKKALRIFENLLKEILTLIENLENSINHLKRESLSYAKAFAILPVKIPMEGLRFHYPHVESWLIENNLMGVYHEILRRITHTNSRLEVLYAHFEGYRSYLDFGTMTGDLKQDLQAILDKLKLEKL